MAVQIIVHLEVRGEWIRQSHVARKRAQNEVSHLYTVGWNDIAKCVMVVAEKFWKVME